MTIEKTELYFGQKLNERTDVCKTDYELLLSKVVVDMYEEIQNLKAQK